MCKYYTLASGSCLKKWQADQLCNGDKAVIQYTSVWWLKEEQSKSIGIEGVSRSSSWKYSVNQAVWNGELFTPLIKARLKWTVFVFTELYFSCPVEKIVWCPCWTALHLTIVIFIRTLTCCFYHTHVWLASEIRKDLVWGKPESPILHTKREGLKSTRQASFFSLL